MIDIDSFEALLDELVGELPAEFFRELSGGVCLSEETKYHPEGRGDLYILGEYVSGLQVGRVIFIYYGSFLRTYGDLGADALKAELRSVLRHELRHHVEALAGDDSLEREDRADLDEYLRGE